MWRKLAIRFYQSIHEADLTLDGFTVIVGPSGSGKSALVRAIKLLVSNARGFSYVSRGSRRTQVVVVDEDSTVFSIERGDGHGSYRLIKDGEEKRYTKLGGAVPDEIASALNVAPEMSFAGQFDRPYLLDDSGQQVARALGELTNVTTIFEAVREANRRRLAQGVHLRARKADFESAREELQQYRTLPTKLKALQRAEEFLDQAKDVESKLDIAIKAIQTRDVAQGVLGRMKDVPEPPSLEPITAVSNRIHRLSSFLGTLDHAGDVLSKKDDAIEVLTRQQELLHHELHEVLVEAGVCPMCGQPTKELTSDQVPSAQD